MFRRRATKATDVYERPVTGTTLQESGRRIPLRHSDTPDYEAVVVAEEAARPRTGRWLLVIFLVLAAVAVAAWQLIG